MSYHVSHVLSSDRVTQARQPSQCFHQNLEEAEVTRKDAAKREHPPTHTPQNKDQDQAGHERPVCRTVLLIPKRVVEECRADYSIRSNMIIPP